MANARPVSTFDSVLQNLLEQIFPFVPAAYKKNKVCGQSLELTDKVVGFKLGKFPYKDSIHHDEFEKYTGNAAAFIYEITYLAKVNIHSYSKLIWNGSKFKSYINSISTGATIFIVGPETFNMAHLLRDAAATILKTPAILKSSFFTGITGKMAVEAVTRFYDDYNTALYNFTLNQLGSKIKLVEDLHAKFKKLSRQNLDEDDIFSAVNLRQQAESLNDEFQSQLVIVTQLADFDFPHIEPENPNRTLHEFILKQMGTLQQINQSLSTMINTAAIASKIESSTSIETDSNINNPISPISNNVDNTNILSDTNDINSPCDEAKHQNNESAVKTEFIQINNIFNIESKSEVKNNEESSVAIVNYQSPIFDDILDSILAGNFDHEKINTILFKLYAYGRAANHVMSNNNINVQVDDRMQLFYMGLPEDTAKVEQIKQQLNKMQDIIFANRDDYALKPFPTLAVLDEVIRFRLEADPENEKLNAKKIIQYNDCAQELKDYQAQSFNATLLLCRIEDELVKDVNYLEAIIYQRLGQAQLIDYYVSQKATNVVISDNKLHFSIKNKEWPDAVMDDYVSSKASKPINKLINEDPELGKILNRYSIVKKLGDSLFRAHDPVENLNNFHALFKVNLPILEPLLDPVGVRIMKNIAVILATAVTLPLLGVGGVLAYKYLFGKREGESLHLLKFAGDKRTLDADNKIDAEPVNNKKPKF